MLGAAATVGVTGAGKAVGVTGAGKEGVDGGLMSTPPNRSRPALPAAGGGLDGPALKSLMTERLNRIYYINKKYSSKPLNIKSTVGNA